MILSGFNNPVLENFQYFNKVYWIVINSELFSSIITIERKIRIEKKEKIFKRINVLLNNYVIPNGKIKLFMEQDRISRRKHAFCHFHI